MYIPKPLAGQPLIHLVSDNRNFAKILMSFTNPCMKDINFVSLSTLETLLCINGFERQKPKKLGQKKAKISSLSMCFYITKNKGL